jgi:nicotinamide-nucleotide amidase
MSEPQLETAARALLDICRARKLTIATAESCTGGLVAGALTDIAGSSDVVDRGFVTYSDAAKEAMLGVPQATLSRYGAVSRQTAEAMAKGVLAHAPVDLAVAVTGIAGPGGGSADKPVGLVHFGAARRGGRLMLNERRYGDLGRAEVRRRSVLEALAMLSELAAGEPTR